MLMPEPQTLIVQTPPKSPKTRPRNSSALSQAIASQRLIADDIAEATDKKLRAVLARAWCDLNEEIRKLRMRPLPKPVDVERPTRRLRAHPAPPLYSEEISLAADRDRTPTPPGGQGGSALESESLFQPQVIPKELGQQG